LFNVLPPEDAAAEEDADIALLDALEGKYSRWACFNEAFLAGDEEAEAGAPSAAAALVSLSPPGVCGSSRIDAVGAPVTGL
jgi:hypothetical protein